MADELVKVTVSADVSPYIRETGKAAAATKQVGTEIDKVSTKAKTSSVAWAAAGAAVTLFGAKAVHGLNQATQAASDLSESTTKMQQIFGASSSTIEAYASNSAQSLGMSKRSALDAASSMAIFGKAAGLTGDDLTRFSTEMVDLSADLASFFDSSPEQAMTAIGAALRGESEPIRQYGVLLDDATLRQRAFEMGLISSTKNALTPQQRALAAQKEILRQTSDAQGDFARTSDGLANTQRRATAEFETAKAELGEALLPVMTDATATAADLMHVFSELPKPLQDTAAALMGVVAAAALIGPGLTATYRAIKAGTDAWKAYRVAALQAAAAEQVAGKGGLLALLARYRVVGMAGATVAAGAAVATAAAVQYSATRGQSAQETAANARTAGYGGGGGLVPGLGGGGPANTSLVTDQVRSAQAAAADAASATRDLASGSDAAAGGLTRMGLQAQIAAQQTDTAAQSAFGYLGALNAVAGAQLQAAGIGDSLAAHLQSNSTASTSAARATGGESRALQAKVDALRKADKAEEDAEIAAARRRAKRKAEARADAGARKDVQAGVAEAIATDKAARAGKDIDGTRQTRSTGEVSGDLTKAEQKALDKQIEGIRARHRKSVDAQVKALQGAAKGQQAMAAATDNASRSLDINTAAGRRNLDWLQQQGATALQVGQQIYDAAIERGESEEEAGRKAGKAILDYRDRLVEAMTQAGFSRDAVLRYLKTLGLTPKTIKTKFLIEVDTKSARDAVDEFARWLREKRPELNVGEVQAIATKTDRYNSPGTNWASGGYISGPGSKTSDSIAARLSHGEYVVRASAVDHYGRGFMDSVNARRFAAGGPVSPRTFYGTARAGGSSSTTHGPSYGMYFAPGAVTVTEATPVRIRVAVMDELAGQAYRRGVVR